VAANRFFPSSKTCSSCGAVKKTLALSEREFVCEECGLVIDRDLNASLNLYPVLPGNQRPRTGRIGTTTQAVEQPSLVEAGTVALTQSTRKQKS